MQVRRRRSWLLPVAVFLSVIIVVFAVYAAWIPPRLQPGYWFVTPLVYDGWKAEWVEDIADFRFVHLYPIVRQRLQTKNIKILDMFLRDDSDFHPAVICFIKIPESDIEKLWTEDDYIEPEPARLREEDLLEDEIEEQGLRWWDHEPFFFNFVFK